ncbi:non-contractile tail tubular protein [Escherichia phage vB_EcoP_PAS7]|uniref:Non-contractile tail tubular protein n=1 Tax=Escherichia phage vB_EcoP_PAS7 TaxID=3053875 RepID=A0AA51Z306_9CAUD|nr:non-contractile tail tubular protein [Escherichia phage vB_EcoP_PAS7]
MATRPSSNALEGTIPSLLQGVSQQIPRERKPGQLGSQVNMLSDPVTGIRRRPAAKLLQDATGIPAPLTGKLFTAYVERGTDGRHLLIDTTNGNWWLLAKNTGSIVNRGNSPYLIASIGAVSIQTASVGGLTYILNTEQRPVTNINNGNKQNPANTGFARVLTGGFNKQWTLNVYANGTVYTSSFYQSQDDIAGSTAAAIAGKWRDGLQSQMPANSVFVQGSSIFVRGTNVSVETDAGTAYALTSGQSRVNQETDLPAVLPATADGALCAVGQAGADSTWYQYDYSKRSWIETGAYNSISSVTNVPLELAVDDNIIERPFEGRLSGDDETNADPYFITNGYFTGIAAFQGRLVLLSGAGITFSASGLYQRYYRSTVTSLLDTDRIDIAAASAQDSVFRTALQFNRDLTIFGDSMQAVVPGGGALTPTNASVTLTSEFSSDSRVVPIVAGQTILYPNRRNEGYAGVLEFLPSPYTASQYTTQDATAHLPRYIPGRIMKMVLSSVTNIGFIQYSGERNALLVHEYLWTGDGKAQAAWHKWTFKQEVLSVHSQSEVMYLFTRNPSSGEVQVQTIDPREGFVADGLYEVPYLDARTLMSVQGGQFTVPAHLRGSDYMQDLALAYPETSGLAGDNVGILSYDGDTGKVVRGVPDGNYYIGFRIPSSFTITPPMIKDANDNLVGSGHVRLLRLDAAARKSGVFYVEVKDTARGVDNDNLYSGLLLNSRELAPDLAPRFELGNVIIPCRTNSDTTEVTFSTRDTLEMNILDISYILKYSPRRRRI